MAGYLTAKQMLDRAATGIGEDDVEFCGGTVKVRGLTAAEDALVTQGAVQVSDGKGSTKFRADLRQRLIIQYGLIEPKMTADEVKQLAATSGSSDFGAIVAKIESLSGTSRDEAEAAAEAFPEPAE